MISWIDPLSIEIYLYKAEKPFVCHAVNSPGTADIDISIV